MSFKTDDTVNVARRTARDGKGREEEDTCSADDVWG